MDLSEENACTEAFHEPGNNGEGKDMYHEADIATCPLLERKSSWNSYLSSSLLP